MVDLVTTSFFSGISCTRCGVSYDPAELHTICKAPGCGRPLAATYDLTPRPRPGPEDLAAASGSIWRFPELMPLTERTEIVTLGEGGTPLLRADRLGGRVGMADLWIKDESGNPTGSFKARGLAAAVTKAKELGARAVAVPTAGNAGGAAAAYAARAGIGCAVVMPRNTPPVFKLEVVAFGAELIEHDGLIDECARVVAERGAAEGWFDLSTLKEPYRVEGKKSMGIEIAEQLGWSLPDVVVYPTGGGTGLIGMWKAWTELEALGWIGKGRPRMYAVQSVRCAPVVTAFEKGADRCERVDAADTAAFGLKVPRPFADEWILSVLRESGGCGVAVAEEQISAGAEDLARLEGIFACPEGGAAWAGALVLLDKGLVSRSERVIVVNTGAAYKYL